MWGNKLPTKHCETAATKLPKMATQKRRSPNERVGVGVASFVCECGLYFGLLNFLIL